MNTIHDALSARVAVEAGAAFLGLIEENMTAKFKAVSDYAQEHFSPEIQPSATGHLQHLHILNEVVSAGVAAKLCASMVPTSPKGHYYAKIVTDSFVMGCMRRRSAHWGSAKYAKELGQMNKALEPLTQDMFEAIEAGNVADKIFLVAEVIKNPLNPGIPDIYFVVPFSTLDGYHFRASLDEIRGLAQGAVDATALEPLPILKKRLDDAERGTKEA